MCVYGFVLTGNSKATAQKNALAIALSNLKVQLRNRETLALEHEVRTLSHIHSPPISSIALRTAH